MNYFEKIEIEKMIKELSPTSKMIFEMMLLLLLTSNRENRENYETFQQLA